MKTSVEKPWTVLICLQYGQVAGCCECGDEHSGCVIAGFRCHVDEIWTLPGYYAASLGNSVPTFRDNLSVSSSQIKKYKTSWLLKMRPIDCPETSAQNYRTIWSLKMRPIDSPETSAQNNRTIWSLKMRPIDCPETSVQNCHSTLRNIPDERRSQHSCPIKCEASLN
jgi:hypothetical protein